MRDKIQYARVILFAARKLLLNINDHEVESNSSMILIVDKMSRLFFYKEKKYFSVSFPFVTLLENNEVLKITSLSGREVDNKNISAVISILDNEQFRLNPSLID